MTNITLIPPKPKRQPLPDDLPGKLRELADAAERGELETLMIAFTRNDAYHFLWPSSLSESLVLATLAQQVAIDKMRK